MPSRLVTTCYPGREPFGLGDDLAHPDLGGNEGFLFGGERLARFGRVAAERVQVLPRHPQVGKIRASGPFGQQRSCFLFGRALVGAGDRFASSGFCHQPGLVFGPEQLVGDAVDGPAHTAHRLGQVFPACPQLFDLGVEHLAALRQIGQYPGSEGLGLLDHLPALGARLGHHGLRLVMGPLAVLGHRCFGLGRAFGQRLLGPTFGPGDLVLRLGEETGRLGLGFGHHLVGGIVGALEHPGRLLAQGRRQCPLVEDGVRRSVLGLGQLVTELNLPLSRHPQGIGYVV